ncbi:hypothetical protein ACLOJK_027894 [Asimina triloba]
MLLHNLEWGHKIISKQKLRMGSDDLPPPGFEGPNVAALQIPLIKWQCPTKLLLSAKWQVAAGEESKEVELENHRQFRELEAVYPRSFAIPASPSVSAEVQNSHYDDSLTLLIPITPVEDDDSPDPSDSAVPLDTSGNLQLPVPHGTATLQMGFRAAAEQSQGNPSSHVSHISHDKPTIGTIPGVEPDVVAAASAAFTAIMRSNEEGSLIDRDLLIKILSNPKLLEQLITQHGLQNDPQVTPKPTAVPITNQVSFHIHRMESDPLPSASSTGQFYPMTNSAAIPTLNPVHTPPHTPASAPVQMTSVQAGKAPPPVRDMNYYKSLIHEHGGERQELHNQAQTRFGSRHSSSRHNHLGMNVETVQGGSKQRDSRSRIPKPCVYFNSPGGCRNGANCLFQHDVSYQRPERQGAKRMKLEREIAGRS